MLPHSMNESEKKMIKLNKFLSLQGVSSGSKATCLWSNELDVLFDIGIFSRNAVARNHLLLSHAHIDHSAGLVYYLSQRKLLSMPQANLYVPEKTQHDFQSIIEAWQRLDGINYDFRLIPVEPNKKYSLKTGYHFIAYPVKHRVPALGYTIFEEKRKLKAKYLQLEPKEIIKLRRDKVAIFEYLNIPLISYLGDCTFDSFIQNPIFRRSRYLILESTFIDKKKSCQHARKWGHIHLDEIFADPAYFKHNEKIIVIHFSCRYGQNYIQKIVKKNCPPRLAEKILIWPVS